MAVGRRPIRVAAAHSLGGPPAKRDVSLATWTWTQRSSSCVFVASTRFFCAHRFVDQVKAVSARPLSVFEMSVQAFAKDDCGLFGNIYHKCIRQERDRARSGVAFLFAVGFVRQTQRQPRVANVGRRRRMHLRGRSRALLRDTSGGSAEMRVEMHLLHSPLRRQRLRPHL